MTQELLRLDNVHLSLPSRAGTVDILRGVSFAAAPGESVGVVGLSGAGKSTLMMVIAGLEQVSSGSVSFRGANLRALDEDGLADLRRGAIGIVFQAFRLIPTLTALENAALPLELMGEADATERAATLLERVGLADRLEHYPEQLSGGEQQRVALARAFVIGPALLLADEPTGNLDSETGEAVVDLMFDLQSTFGTTLVLITHDRALAARCERIVTMRDGMLFEEPQADRARRVR